MSGTGKSCVIRELVARGYRAVDADAGYVDVSTDGTQRWREDAIDRLLEAEDADVLFLAGCEENMASFLPRFDDVVLLSAPKETLLERLEARTNNPFGKGPGEIERILHDLETVEPRLREIADHEVRTTAPLDDVVVTILRLVGDTR
jgi:dephospho-CoA kinase